MDGKFKKLITNIMTASEDTADCDECFDHVDQFAEMYARGEDAAAILPRVEKHLAQCRDCGEEYNALLSVLRSDVSGQDGS